jgi:hypothetical protein
MSPAIADLLRTTARERKSFIVMAVPRLAGKSTVLHAMASERPRTAPLRTVAEDGDDIDDLLAESRGGYIVIPEISRGAHAPGYIWGAPVRRIFKGIGEEVSLAVALHAPGPKEAFDIICGGCGVPDADASKISLVVYLRSIGHWEEPTRRVVDAVHEISGVRDGRPRAKLLFHWDEQKDRFTAG